MIVQAVREWLKTYSGLADDRLTIDYEPDEINSHALYNTTTSSVVKKYLSGQDMQFDFVVASCEAYGDQIAGNIDNLRFFADLQEWVEQQNKRPRHMPMLPEGKTPQKIIVTSPGYLFQTSEDGKARYQMQLKLLYHERKI